MTNDVIAVVTADPIKTRSGKRTTEFRTEDLSVNISLFIEQMSHVLEKTPDKIGRFQFVEFEVHAEVSAKGTLSLLGTGGERNVSIDLVHLFSEFRERFRPRLRVAAD